MPLPPGHVKERLHVSYVNAIAAKAGVNCAEQHPDFGVDISISEVEVLDNGRFQPSGHLFHCQLKATTTCEVNGDYIIYDMEVEDYNKLADWRGASPCILVLFSLPEDENDWLTLDEEQLLLKKCCYWQHIEGPRSENRSSQRVRIPRIQRFDHDAILRLLDWVKQETMGNGYLTE